jgi:hypothetical protein
MKGLGERTFWGRSFSWVVFLGKKGEGWCILVNGGREKVDWMFVVLWKNINE